MSTRDEAGNSMSQWQQFTKSPKRLKIKIAPGAGARSTQKQCLFVCKFADKIPVWPNHPTDWQRHSNGLSEPQGCRVTS